jgi:hypothetical protein
MYEISKRSFKIAKQYGLEIFPSSKKNKKIDVYKDREYLASIGDIRYKDYHIYLKEQGTAYANERARLYYGRHQKVSMKEQLAKLLLWT